MCETGLQFVCFPEEIFTTEDGAVQLVIWHTAAGELTACHSLGLVLFWEPEEQSSEVKRAQWSRVDGKDT